MKTLWRIHWSLSFPTWVKGFSCCSKQSQSKTIICNQVRDSPARISCRRPSRRCIRHVGESLEGGWLPRKSRRGNASLHWTTTLNSPGDLYMLPLKNRMLLRMANDCSLDRMRDAIINSRLKRITHAYYLRTLILNWSSAVELDQVFRQATNWELNWEFLRNVTHYQDTFSSIAYK